MSSLGFRYVPKADVVKKILNRQKDASLKR